MRATGDATKSFVKLTRSSGRCRRNSLEGNRLTDRGAQLLAAVLPQMPRLRTLTYRDGR